MREQCINHEQVIEIHDTILIKDVFNLCKSGNNSQIILHSWRLYASFGKFNNVFIWLFIFTPLRPYISKMDS